MALGCLEDLTNDELRRDGAVPAVLLQAEEDVVAHFAPRAIGVASEAERDRGAGGPVTMAHAEAQVLPVSRLGDVGEIARREEEGHPWVAEAERREVSELRGELERQLLAGNDRVHLDPGLEILLRKLRVDGLAERLREGRELRGVDGQPSCGAVPAEPREMLGAGPECPVKVERRDRPPGSLPVAVGAGDQDDRSVEALDEP